jgi:hypothetical protein
LGRSTEEGRSGRRRLWAWLGVAAAAVFAASAFLAIRYERKQSAEAKILKAVGNLRQDFRHAVNASQGSRQPYVTAAEADINAILSLDPNNGTGFYYLGEIKRLNNPALFTEKSCPIAANIKGQQGELDAYETDFYHYLDVEASLPDSEKGGSSSAELCYSRPSGYCPQRTAWIDHLLANDLYLEASAANNQAAQSAALSRALKLAQKAVELYQDEEHNPGFTQCQSTESLIRLIQSRLPSNGQ